MVVSAGFVVSRRDEVGSHLTAYTVQDGDGLNGNTGAHQERRGVVVALGGRIITVRGVIDLCTGRTADAYADTLHGVIGRGNDRSCYAA